MTQAPDGGSTQDFTTILDNEEYIRTLFRRFEVEYYGYLEIYPDWDITLGQYVRVKGLTKDQVWQVSPETGWNEGWKEPDWL